MNTIVELRPLEGINDNLTRKVDFLEYVVCHLPEDIHLKFSDTINAIYNALPEGDLRWQFESLCTDLEVNAIDWVAGLPFIAIVLR